MHFVSRAQMEKRADLLASLHDRIEKIDRFLERKNPEIDLDDTQALKVQLEAVVAVLNRDKFSMIDMREAEAMIKQIDIIYMRAIADMTRLA